MNKEIRFASLISGGGSTMEAMGKACQEGELVGLARPVVVISSREGEEFERFEGLGIPMKVVTKGKNDSVETYGEALLEMLSQYSPEVVTLNGFLNKISPEMIQEYEDRIFNQHPGPVPEFGGKGMYGKRVHEAVLGYTRSMEIEDPYTEMTVQKVAFEYDMGAVVEVRMVAIRHDDTAESLQQRCLTVEHWLQIELLKDLAMGDLKEINRQGKLFGGIDLSRLETEKAKAKILHPNG